MFETFNVPGMYIATQAVLCLYANELSSREGGAVVSVCAMNGIWTPAFLAWWWMLARA